MADLEKLLKEELPDQPSMRDIFDFCKRHSIPALAQGMIEFPPPEKLRTIAGTLVASPNGGHQYRSRQGEPEYLFALKDVLKKVYHTDLPSTDALLATSGVTGAIFASLLMCYHKHGIKKAGLVNPFYTYHARDIALAMDGAEPMFCESITKDGSFDIDFESVEKNLKAGMRALIVCNPGNPSGKLYSKSTLNALVALAAEYDCFLILDEIYADLVWAKNEFYSPVQDELYPHVISCRGFSKNLACQSWRAGYIISHPKTVKDILQYHDPVYISVPILQHALATYLREETSDYVNHIKRANHVMERNVEALGATFAKVFGWEFLRPQGSMYVMFRHTEESDMAAVVKALLKGVGIAPGSMFFNGYPANSGFVRIHVGLAEDAVATLCADLEKK